MKNKNMMKTYLGNEYSNNHVRNFCLYWLKGLERRKKALAENGPTLRDISVKVFTDEMREDFEAWRKENDLDCLYFDGDLCADTLMSAWTPIQWVANYINREWNKSFYKPNSSNGFATEDLQLLANDTERYLPHENELVKLLDRFLSLAEERCNYILLPDRGMNAERFNLTVRGRTIRLYDMVPATLYYLFDENALGRYFKTDQHVISWLKREHLEMGFSDEVLDRDHVIPLIPGVDPKDTKMLTEKQEIKEALKYMINFLEKRYEKFKIEEIKRRENMIRIDRRPERLKSDVLWDAYNRLFELKNPYIWYGVKKRRYDKPVDELFFISNIKLSYNKKRYYGDN